MKIEEGKYYRRANGEKAGPAQFDKSERGKLVWNVPVVGGGGEHWYDRNGYSCTSDLSCDLIAEWTDETETQTCKTCEGSGVVDKFSTWEGSCPDCKPETQPETQPDTPKLWRYMTPEEKGALLLAHHEGKVIEFLHRSGEWCAVATKPVWYDSDAYRTRPEPKRETVALCWKKGLAMGEVGTIDLIDGQPDPASIKMEEM